VPFNHLHTTLLQTIAKRANWLRSLDDPEEIKDDQDRSDHQQRVNPAASAWKSRANASTKKAE
jgi:hypothetical protein